MIKCYAFGAVPPFAQGLVRDLRVRWALEEADLPYRVMLVGDRPGETQRWAQERRPAAVEAVRTDSWRSSRAWSPTRSGARRSRASRRRSPSR
jgi:hypothetical protein